MFSAGDQIMHKYASAFCRVRNKHIHWRPDMTAPGITNLTLESNYA